MIRRGLGALAAAAVVALGAWLGAPEPGASAIGPGDAVGEYALRLKGDGFDRAADSGRVSQDRIRGRALLSVTRTTDAADPHDLTVLVTLASSMKGSLLDRATPTPALTGRGILVEDSLTVIGNGQSNFVNALTLRFAKKGKRVDGWWMASFQPAEVATGYAAGVGVVVKGKRLRVSPAAAATAR